MTLKVVTFTKNGLTVPVGLSDTMKVEQLKADGWLPIPEVIMEKDGQQVIVKDDVQQSAFENQGFIKVGEKDPLAE